MRYLVCVIDHETGFGTAPEMAAIGAFSDRLRADGLWVLAGGLEPSSQATVIDHGGAGAVFAEGPCGVVGVRVGLLDRRGSGPRRRASLAS